MKTCSLIFGLILNSCVLAQQASPVLLGSWTATAGSNQIFRGTWSAQRTGKSWQGTWTARPIKGQLLSGTWTADAASLNGDSLAEMLKSTATKEVTGSWRSGRYQGNWSLKGSPIKKLP
jgi:hypothetical protein